MPKLTDLRAFARMRCCPPPPRVTGVTAQPGGGSGEVVVSWNPLPPGAGVAFYRVYQRRGPGIWWHLAVVDPSTLGAVIPGRMAVVDAPDYFPWPANWSPSGARCYTVTAIATTGLEGPMSAEACGSPP